MHPTTHSIALTLIGFTAGAVVVFGLDRLPSIKAAPEPSKPASKEAPLSHRVPVPASAAASPGFAEAVAAAAPAVVKVYGRGQPHTHPSPSSTLSAGYLAQPRARSRLGSGVVIARNGLIVTNSHVVRGLARIEVELIDGRRAVADLLGIDEATDLALLRVPFTDLPSIEIGDPTQLRIGDLVLTIGNPFGIGQTASLGVVSGTGRSQLGLTEIEDFIQTDAAINPGSSGGALIDIEGRLVGIATAGISESGHSEGVGLAIPASLVMQVVEALSAHDHPAPGWIGLGGRSVTSELEQRFGLRTSRGVLVSTLDEQGPAAAAGLRAGDVITGFNGVEIDDALQLQALISETRPGSAIELTVSRGSERIQMQLHIDGSGPAQRDPTAAHRQRQAQVGQAVTDWERAATPSARPGCQHSSRGC
ncbi:S1C family serine protease [Halochromatium glycolicum]|uniref:PDZ domain-containing protein n=1 Tax=Halochromatium glycolicum TaxID=85075 RepID=A0AAJ0XA49_9GAMM|nr:trypsin-like peptidase domain-containing protein [Halochromatium glycolicum]MBK1705454.1 hypothetical protein [Halochromatium glycolicum]